MENLGDLLYVLIIIIVAITSIVKAFKKRQQQAVEMQQPQQPRPVVTTDREEKDPWEYWEEGQRAILPEAIPEPVPVRQSMKKPLQANKTFRIKQDYVSSPTIAYTDTPMSSVAEDYAAVTLEDLPHEPAEWRKAFVYNVIFQKKY